MSSFVGTTAALSFHWIVDEAGVLDDDIMVVALLFRLSFPAFM
jgi:hypothetical protein